MCLIFHIVPFYYIIFAEYYNVRRNNIFYYNWSVFWKKCRISSQTGTDSNKLPGGGDSAGNFPSWGIKETNDLAEPELHNHMLVHHLAVKQWTNQRLAIMGHTRNSNQTGDCSRSKLVYISLWTRLQSTPAPSGGDTHNYKYCKWVEAWKNLENDALSSLHKLLHTHTH